MKQRIDADKKDIELDAMQVAYVLDNGHCILGRNEEQKYDYIVLYYAYVITKEHYIDFIDVIEINKSKILYRIPNPKGMTPINY